MSSVLASHRTSIWTWRIVLLLSIMIVWQWGWSVLSFAGDTFAIFDPFFISNPQRIGARFLQLACIRSPDNVANSWEEVRSCFASNDNNLFLATLTTLKNTIFGFAYGLLSGVAAGILLGRSDKLAQILNPFVVGLNAIPRIAIVPLIILVFGLGDFSKIVTAWTIVFFTVFFNTFEGTRSVDRDQIAVARLLGATQMQIIRKVVVPSTMAWVFASLVPAVSGALIGVIVGEFIGTERGLGKIIIESEAQADASGMMVAICVLIAVGMVLTYLIKLLQQYLLRWQQTGAE